MKYHFSRIVGFFLMLTVLAGLSGCAQPENPPLDPEGSDSIHTEEKTMPNNTTDPLDPKRAGYVVVTDYVKSTGLNDVTEELQKLIDDNPNRTIYFPDGCYLISKPLQTSADPKKSVALMLSNYAIIRADKTKWNSSSRALIQLGALNSEVNSTLICGNWFLKGGILDGNDVASGVSVDGGREVVISGVAIKNTQIGIHVKRGVNGGSSDADISDVNILGNGDIDSIGILVDGMDNTFTNIRIGRTHVGVHIKNSGGNMLRNVHPLMWSEGYETSVGFIDEHGSNFYDYCYSDNYRVAYQIAGGKISYYNNCFAYWYGSGLDMTVFRSEGAFCSYVSVLRAGFHDQGKSACVLEETGENGAGEFGRVDIDGKELLSEDDAYYQYACKQEVKA